MIAEAASLIACTALVLACFAPKFVDQMICLVIFWLFAFVVLTSKE
jgi:hypothetical protein